MRDKGEPLHGLPDYPDRRTVVRTSPRSNVIHRADIDQDLTRRGWRVLVAFTAVTLVSTVARSASAQGEISGRVMVSDSSRSLIQGAEVSITRLGRTALTDSSGRFRLKDVPRGRHLVMLRAGGFRPESSMVTIDFVDEVVSWDVVLTRTTGTMLPVRVVEASGEPPSAKLVEFLERQKLGIGHFIDRAQLEKAEGGRRQTGDVIALAPGVAVKRGSNKIWVASSRAPRPTTCAFCPQGTGFSTSAAATPGGLNRADFVAGARPACYMDVFLDGAMVFDSRNVANGLFDVNTVPPEHIAGIEVYSPAQVPIKYARNMDNPCGVVLIWTR